MAEPAAATSSGAPSTTPFSLTLNDLPKDILLHILSFVPTESAIQTSLISRKWRNLWSHLPSLQFLHSSSYTLRATADFIHQTLLNRPFTSPPLRRFHLEFDFTDPLYSSHVDSWVRYAVSHRARELHLDFFINPQLRSQNEPTYEFPLSVLRNGSVEVLTLIKCDLKLPAGNMTSSLSMELKLLTSIFFDQIDLTDEVVRDLVSGCVNLEYLTLEYCYGMKDVKISSLKLKKLCLNYFHCDENGSLELSCPNLGSLEMIGFELDRYELKDISVLTEASVFFLHKQVFYRPWSQLMSSLAHLPILSVQNWWLKYLSTKDVSSGGYILYNLKHVELRTEYSKSDLLGIAAMLEHSPNLETMELGYLRKLDDDEHLSEELVNKPIEFTIPKLKQVKIKDFRAMESVAMLVSLLIVHGIVLEQVILHPPEVEDGVVPPAIVLSRQLKHGKLSKDLVHNIKFKDCIDE